MWGPVNPYTIVADRAGDTFTAQDSLCIFFGGPGNDLDHTKVATAPSTKQQPQHQASSGSMNPRAKSLENTQDEATRDRVPTNFRQENAVASRVSLLGLGLRPCRGALFWDTSCSLTVTYAPISKVIGTCRHRTAVLKTVYAAVTWINQHPSRSVIVASHTH